MVRMALFLGEGGRKKKMSSVHVEEEQIENSASRYQ